MGIRVLVVDDHAVVRQGLRMYLRTDPELDLVGEAGDGQQALDLARQLRPDVILMDLLMPVMDGIEATKLLRKELPDTEVIALTSVLEDKSVIAAVKAGAIGYLLKDTEAEALCISIKAAAEGKVQLSPEAAARLVREVNAPDKGSSLSPREVEVLQEIAGGRSNKEIAVHLKIGESTVKTHVANIFEKLGVQSRTQAALVAAQRGLASLAGS